MKRARTPLLSLAALVLLGTVVLWVGTWRTGYRWGTNSLPGERQLHFGVVAGHIDFGYLDSKRFPDYQPEVGFESYPVSERLGRFFARVPKFSWNTSPGIVDGRCPIWFPGTLTGGVLLGWGLLCRRDGEGNSGGEEAR